MKLWMIGWSCNSVAEMGYMLFSYTLANTREEALNKYKHAQNDEPHSVELYPEQEDLDEWKKIFQKSGDWIE